MYFTKIAGPNRVKTVTNVRANTVFQNDEFFHSLFTARKYKASILMNGLSKLKYILKGAEFFENK